MKENFRTIRIKLYTVIITACILLSSVALFTAYVKQEEIITNKYNNLLRNVSDTTEGIILKSDLSSFLKGENPSEYINLNNKLRKFKNDLYNVDVILVAEMHEDGMYSIFDTSSDELRGGLSTYKEYDISFNKIKKNIFDKEVINDFSFYSGGGRVTTYGIPLSGIKNEYPVYIFVGVSDNLIENEKKAFIVKNGRTVGLLSFILLIFAILIVELRIIKPIKKISKIVKKASEQYDHEFLNNLIENEIKTGNEIENIYKCLIKIYTSKLRIKNVIESDNEDKNGVVSLIKRMDNYTESHMDNSLQYVIVIMNELRNRDEYKEFITDSLYKDTILSAPLHDVGKLAIPPEILNKPAKLTKEEHDIIKKHTVYGARIIDEIYCDNRNDNYLILAKEIALHHHEKWDGTGYPHNLKGEEIPLVVRVMSIADVFDALVSKRVYKKAYSFEESFNMVIHDSGTFFDPELIEVFKGIKDKLYNVYLNNKRTYKI